MFFCNFGAFMVASLKALPVISLLTVPRQLFGFGSLVILDVACCYLWLFSLYVNIKIDKNSYSVLD